MSERWHFLDARSKAIAYQGVKLEFASHMDAGLGKRVLNALEAERDSQAKLIARLVGALAKAHAWPPHQTREEWVKAVGRDADAGKTDPAEMIWREPIVWCHVCQLVAEADLTEKEANDGRA